MSIFDAPYFLTSSRMPETLIELKSESPTLTAVCVCRSCYVARNLKEKPALPHAADDVCSFKGCENPSAFIVAFSPYDLKRQ